jgi:hypothetical protein
MLPHMAENDDFADEATPVAPIDAIPRTWRIEPPDTAACEELRVTLEVIRGKVGVLVVQRADAPAFGIPLSVLRTLLEVP